MGKNWTYQKTSTHCNSMQSSVPGWWQGKETTALWRIRQMEWWFSRKTMRWVVCFFFSYFFVYELTCSYFYDGRLGIGFHPLKLKAAYCMTVENVQKHGSRTIWGLKSTIPQQGITFNYVPMTNLCIYWLATTRKRTEVPMKCTKCYIMHTLTG